DGIRDFHVTGVQTCALPISPSETCAGKTGDEHVDARTLEALGALGAKLGHDFNNLFGSIQGAADLIRLRSEKLMPGQAPFKRQLELIQSSLNKASAMTGKVRAFVRPGELVMEPVDLRRCAEAVCELLADSGAGIEIGGAAELTVNGNEFAITSTLTALCSNALDAMAGLPDRV